MRRSEKDAAYERAEFREELRRIKKDAA